MRTLLIRTAAFVAFLSLVAAAMQSTLAQQSTGQGNNCMFQPVQWMPQQWQPQTWQGQMWNGSNPAPTAFYLNGTLCN